MNKEKIASQSEMQVKRAIEDLFGIHMISQGHHGHRDYIDIKKCGYSISNIFDVGANIGQSVLKFRVAFPKAAIYCFEPVRETFETLKENTANYAGISYYQTALGSGEGEAEIYLTGQSNASSLIRPGAAAKSEKVMLRTIDGFAADNKIGQIDILKIDTEGFDLEVLKGARHMLSSHKIAFVLAEVGFNPGDNRNVLFDDVRLYFLPMGYALFGIYEQQLEWSGEKRLRYANVCFVCEDLVERDGQR